MDERDSRDERMRELEAQVVVRDKRIAELEARVAQRDARIAELTGMAREILRLEKCLWTFVDVPGLEPTNNLGERCIRHAVMSRKTSFRTQSEEGSRFVERIFTANTTLESQNRNVLAFLTETLAAHHRGLQGPPLLTLSSRSLPDAVNGYAR
jgi:transposase